MKLKSLLPAIAFVAAGLTASAVVPVTFRDACGDAVDGGGHMEFPFVEGTEKVNENAGAGGIHYGTAQFAEDGSIELRPFAAMNSSMGIYFRTQKFGRTEAEGPFAPEYTIFAMDYKSNLAANDMVMFFHEGCPEPPQVCNGPMIEVTNEWKSTYFPFVRQENGWGTDNWANNYNWISWNDANIKTPEWRLTIKNLRLLTVAEAEAECASAVGDYADSFACANGDVVSAPDEEMDNALAYVRADGAANPVLMTSNIVKPLPANNTKFTFEYKFVGAEPAVIAFHAVQGGAYSTTNVLGADTPKLEPCEDQYEAEWKTYEADMSDLIANYNFGQKFACGDFLHVQLKGLTEGTMLYLRNPKWVDPKGGAVEIIEGIDENAPVEYFNLQGVRVAEPANGLYIKRQGNKATKVLVK